MSIFTGKSKQKEDLNYYKNTLDELADLIVRFNCNFEITFINRPLLIRYNADEDTVISSDFLDWIHPDFKKQVHQALIHIDSRNQYYECEIKDKVIPGDRQDIWRLWKIKGIINKENVINEYFAVGTELTHPMDVSGKQIESVGQYRTLVENQSDLVARLDPDFRLTFMNHAYKAYFNITDNSMLGKSYTELLPRERQNQSIIRMRQINQSNSTIKYIAKYIDNSGMENWQQWLSQGFFNKEGNIEEILSIGRDVTELIIAQEKLEEAKSTLLKKQEELKAKNITLHEILNQIENEKKMINNNVLHNIEVVILPLLDQYRNGADEDKISMLNVLEDSFGMITSNFGRSMTNLEYKMSPREIEICNLIRNGLTSKEISSQLRISFNTVETHRTRIRKKLKLEGKKISLISFLRNLARR